jgi:hypothetical protein
MGKFHIGTTDKPYAQLVANVQSEIPVKEIVKYIEVPIEIIKEVIIEKPVEKIVEIPKVTIEYKTVEIPVVYEKIIEKPVEIIKEVIVEREVKIHDISKTLEIKKELRNKNKIKYALICSIILNIILLAVLNG